MKKSFILACIMMPMAVFGNESAYLASAENLLNTTRIICGGISDELAHVAGIGKAETAINAVGTAAGGGAVYAGFSKAHWDQEIAKLINKMCAGGGCAANRIKSMSEDDFVNNVLTPLADMSKLSDEIANAEKKSKALGNWRTGLMAGNTATNIASSIVAGMNKNQSDLVQHVIACNNALNNLNLIYANLLNDGINPYENPTMIKIEKIRKNCGTIRHQDISAIEKSMAGVMGVGIGGAVVGVAGTAVSATANSNKIRNDNSDTGQQKEKNLNTAANALAIAGMGASVAGTVTSASMISKINKLINLAQYCEEAL